MIDRLLSCCVTKDVPLHDVRRHCRSLRAEHRIGECAGACGEPVDPFSSAIPHAVREAVPQLSGWRCVVEDVVWVVQLVHLAPIETDDRQEVFEQPDEAAVLPQLECAVSTGDSL